MQSKIKCQPVCINDVFQSGLSSPFRGCLQIYSQFELISVKILNAIKFFTPHKVTPEYMLYDEWKRRRDEQSKTEKLKPQFI